MVKEKSLSGSKKRESRARLSITNSLAHNVVDVPFQSQLVTENTSAISYDKYHNLSKYEISEHLKECLPSKLPTMPSTPNPTPIRYDPFYVLNVATGGISHQDMNANINMPVSQYYFLTKLMHQQKKVLEPDSINVKKSETSTSNNVTCTATNTLPSTMPNPHQGTIQGAKPDTNSIDHRNNNVENLEELMCQCPLVLDPYPSQLSLR